MTEASFSKKAIGEIWLDHHGHHCLILDDDPQPDEDDTSLIKLGFTFSIYVCLEKEEEIRNRYGSSNYIADPNSILKIISKGMLDIPSNRLYIDMLSVRKVSNNAFTVKTGELQQDAVLDILIEIENFKEGLQERHQGRRNAPVIQMKYDYDVAISFAGEEREIARSIAYGLRDQGFSVFL